MTSEFDLKGANDEELARYTKMMWSAHDLMQQRLNAHGLKISLAEAERDRRALEEYWKAHPDEVPFRIGDKLDMSRFHTDLDTITGISMSSKQVFLSNIFSIEWNDAQQARAAYLESEDK